MYGILPWHLERMTLREVQEYLADLRKLEQHIEEENRRGR